MRRCPRAVVVLLLGLAVSAGADAASGTGAGRIDRAPEPPLIAYRLWWVDLGPLAGQQVVERVRRAGPATPLGGETWIVTADLLPQLVQALHQRQPPAATGRVATAAFPESQAGAGEVVGTLGTPVRLRLGARPLARSPSAPVTGARAVETSLSVELLGRSVDAAGRVEVRVALEVDGAGAALAYAHTVWLGAAGAPVAYVVNRAAPTAWALAVAAEPVRPPSAEGTAVRFADLDAFESQALTLLAARPARATQPLQTRLALESSLGQTAPRWQLALRHPLAPGAAVEASAGWQGTFSGGPFDARAGVRVRLLYELDLLADLAAATKSAGNVATPAVAVGLEETTRPLPALVLHARLMPLVYTRSGAGRGEWVPAPSLWSAGVSWQQGTWVVGIEGAREWPGRTIVTVGGAVRLASWLAAYVGYRYGWEAAAEGDAPPQAVVGVVVRPGGPPSAGLK